jgi:hypothetical protein
MLLQLGVSSMRTTLRDLATRAWRHRRRPLLLAIVGLLAVIRIALPYALRPIAVSQSDSALVGRIELEDIDLSLLRGGITLHGLEVHAQERPVVPAEAEPATEAKPASEGEPETGARAVAQAESLAQVLPPVFEAKRLWVQISWLALLTKTIEVEELELEGFAVRVDRQRDGLVLPKAAPSDAPPAPEPEEEPEPSSWSFAADSVVCRDGRFTFRDFSVSDPPQEFDFNVQDLSARDLALVIDPTGREPGRLVVSARIGEGTVDLDAQVESRPAGPSVVSTIKLASFPIGGIRPYLTMFGWSDLIGRFGAAITHRYETGGRHEVGGTVSLSDVAVSVPGLGEPALAWTELAVGVDSVDLVGQTAGISSVKLDGARVAVDATAQTPLLLMTPPASPRAEPAGEPESATPEPAAETKPWKWKVDALQVSGAQVRLLSGPEPLPLGVDLGVEAISSETGSKWPIELRVQNGDGTLGVDGVLVVTPVSFEGKVSAAGFSLPPILARIGVPATEILRQAALRAEIDVSYVPPPAPAEGSVEAGADLKVSGTVGLEGLDVAGSDEQAFRVGWKDLDIAIGELSLAGLAGGAETGGRSPRGALKLDRVSLVEPTVRLTRETTGLVLPEPGGGGAASSAETPPQPAGTEPESATAVEAEATPPSQTGEPPAAQAEAADASGDGVAITVSLANLEVQQGSAEVLDRTVEPFYRGRIDRLDLKASGVSWPAGTVDDLSVDLKGLQGTELSVRGGVVPGKSKINCKIDGLPLSSFNPYIAPNGISLASGALSLETKASIRRQGYGTSTKLLVRQLELGDARQDSRFEQDVGIAPSLAIALLRDLNGDITLTVPVDIGREGGARLEIGSIVRQALIKAVMGALTSPLKLLGAVTAGGKVERLAPEPILFTAGTTTLAGDGTARIEQIANLMAASPALSLSLNGVSAPADHRWLQEQALLEELRKTSGIRALGQLGEIGTRRAVRSYLEERLEDKEATLEPEDEAWFEAQVAARVIDRSALEELATARASVIRDRLVAEHGIAAERLALAPATIAQESGSPSVTISVGAPTRPAPNSGKGP